MATEDDKPDDCECCHEEGVPLKRYDRGAMQEDRPPMWLCGFCAGSMASMAVRHPLQVGNTGHVLRTMGALYHALKREIASVQPPQVITVHGDAKMTTEQSIIALKRFAGTLKPAPEVTDQQLEFDITRVIREADQKFESIGGSTRHYVRDCLIPALQAGGLAIRRIG